MKKLLFGLIVGMAAGAVIAYQNEDEIEDAYHSACRCKKKVMRKLHHMQMEH